MKPRRQISFLRLSLAVVIPLVVLSALSAAGIRAQWLAAENAMASAARNIAEICMVNITNELKDKFRPVPRFADPPVPGPEDEDDALTSMDPVMLRAIRDDEGENAVTPAGLPRRAVAAMRLVDITGDRADAEAAVEVVTGPSPSIITRDSLARIERSFPGLASGRLASWHRAEIARRLLDRGSDPGPRGEWRDDFHLRRSAEGFTFIHRDDLVTAVKAAETSAGAATRLRLSLDHRVIHGPSGRATEMRTHGAFVTAGFPEPSLATVMLPYGESLQLDVVAVDLSAFRSLVRRQTVWFAALLVLAIAGAAAGLWIIRRTLERERHLNAMKSDFVAGVSHELRAPIASIRLMADALEEGKIPDKTAGEFHRLISREGARLSTLIENVLDFARIEQGRKEWRREESDLSALIRGTLPLMEPLAAEKRIILEAADLPDTAPAFVDPGAIQQALVNLIDNAIKFSPADSHVAIRLSDDADGRWNISVEDKGAGIPESEHQRIFEKFHRLGGELRRETQGTGIGLSLVKAIAAAHEGSIDLQSAPGKGSTFTLILPAAA